MDQHYLFIGENRVCYKVVGEGEPLFLIHGYQTDSQLWNDIVPHLSKTYQLIIPDLPGHGQSTVSSKLNGMEMLATVILKIATALRLQVISIAGHSMGGYVALYFAHKNPLNVRKLFLINSHPFPDNFNKALGRERESDLISKGKNALLIKSFIKNSFSESFRKNNEKAIRKFTEVALSQPVDGMLADLAGMMARNERTDVATLIKEKIIVILGEEDDTIPEHLFMPFQGRFLMYWIPDCGHMSVVEKPAEVAEIILEF